MSKTGLPEPRRFYPRREFDAKVGVLHNGHFYYCKSHDIGEKGIQVAIPFDLEKTDELLLSFFVMGGFISTLGVIRNSINRNGELMYGLEFSDINFEDRRHIREFVAHKSTSGLNSGNKQVV